MNYGNKTAVNRFVCFRDVWVRGNDSLPSRDEGGRESLQWSCWPDSGWQDEAVYLTTELVFDFVHLTIIRVL